jgi:hypothetical protein
METKFVLRRIGIASAMKVGASVFAVLGFIFGILWGIIAAFFTAFLGMLLNRPSPEANALFLINVVVFNTIGWAIAGTIGTFLFTLVFNMTSGILGGIDLELDQIGQPVPEYADEPRGVV